MNTASPCTGVCSVSAKGICLGCGRTLDEIAAWSGATEAQRREIVRRAEARREAASGG